MPRKPAPEYEVKQIRPQPGREGDYRAEEIPEYEKGDFFATRHPKLPGLSKIAKDYHFYVKMPEGDYMPLGYQMHRVIKRKGDMKRFVDWLDANIGSVGSPEEWREVFRTISEEDEWKNENYLHVLDESLRKVIRDLILENHRANRK